MAIRTNDLYDEDLDDFYEGQEEQQETVEIQNEENIIDNTNIDPIIQELLRAKGIEDINKIKFENEDGELEEHDWNSLSNEDKLGILQQEDTYNPEEGLDDAEIELINAIRTSKMTPSEYLNYIQNTGIDNYINNQSLNQPQYRVDNIDDATLYVMDIIARLGEDAFTDDELKEMLENAQSNPESFAKQIKAIRNEYKIKEDQSQQQIKQAKQSQQIEQYNQFAESIENEIRNFTSIGGYDINMDESEMEEIYDFLTGFDAAGVSTFGKALNNPKLLVKMAWWALNGEQAIQDINDYWTNEIKNISRNLKKQNNQVQIVNKKTKKDSFDDFDDEFFA